jgi:hypothetical protein
MLHLFVFSFLTVTFWEGCVHALSVCLFVSYWHSRNWRVVLHVELVPGGIRASVGHRPRSKLGPDPDQKPILTCACAYKVSPVHAWLLHGLGWGGGGASRVL